MSKDYRGHGKYQRKNSARRIRKAKGIPPGPAKSKAPQSELGYETIARPSGPWWDERRRFVLRRDAGKPCLWCGQPVPMGQGVIDHLVPLSIGSHLVIPTNHRDHPLNTVDNLRYVHKACNGYRGSIEDISAARRRVAARLKCEVYEGPCPDLRAVRARLDAIAGAPAPEPVTDDPDAWIGERDDW